MALPNLVQWLVLSVGNDVLGLGFKSNDALTQGVPVPGVAFTPHHNYKIGGVVLNSDQIAVFVVAALAAIVLWFVIRRTRVGLEMRAVVDREGLAALRGVNAARTSAVAWIMTMILAGLGGVLIAPLFQLQDFVFTLVVLGSLAAVVFGGLRSIPLAFAGGLLLGVVQNLVAGYSDRFLPELPEQPERIEVVGAVPAGDRAVVVVRSRTGPAGRVRGRRRAAAGSSGRVAEVAAPVAVGGVDADR